MKCISLVVLFVLVAQVICEQRKDESIKGSIPTQIYRCMQRHNLLRCLKFFVLLRIESRDYSFNSNSTMDFLGSILKSEKNLPSHIPDVITRLSDEELDDRLTEGIQKFYKDRPIQLHFIPNMLVKVVPTRGNDLEFSLKRIDGSGRDIKESTKVEEDSYYDDSDESDVKDDKVDKEKDKDEVPAGDMKKDELEKSGVRRKASYLQVGVPLLLTPYMVFVAFLPMIIPVLKFATVFTTIVNLTALVASIFYLARQHALDREMQQTIYFNPGYKERRK